MFHVSKFLRMIAVSRARARVRALPRPGSGHRYIYVYTVSLLVTVAELAAHRVHQVAENLVLAGKAKGNAISELLLARRRAVVEGFGAVDGILAAFGVECLPDSPHAVDHSVVEEEDRVVRGRVEVLHLRGTTTEPVAGAVDTELVVTNETLHLGLEVLDVGLAEQKLGDVLYTNISIFPKTKTKVLWNGRGLLTAYVLYLLEKKTFRSRTRHRGL